MAQIERIASFYGGDGGGNPAGVWIGDHLPDPEEMQRIAQEVGYSETAFAAPVAAGGWRVRYFAPETEVPFCGHATIALGAALGARCGAGQYDLTLNAAEISVEAISGSDDAPWSAALVSPPTHSEPAEGELAQALLAAFELGAGDFAPGAEPMRAHGGADHLVWRLRDVALLEQLGAEMAYPFEHVRALMERAGFVTIALIVEERPGVFRARNAFAAGGVREDPATGAAAAAFAGLLRDLGALPAGGEWQIRQGVEMGRPSLIHVAAGEMAGAGVTVSGACRWID